jgi:excisionase family DNA binding protein
MNEAPMSIGLAEKSAHKAGVRTIVADGLMTVPEAAKFLRISRSKLYETMDKGELAYVKLGKPRRIPRRAVIDLVSRQLRGGYRE